MSETQPDLREALVSHYLTAWNNTDLMATARADSLLAPGGPLAPILAQVSALQAEVERLKLINAEVCKSKNALLLDGARLSAEVERLQKVEGEREKGRVPPALGSQASPEAPSDLRPKGFDPARDALATTLQHLSNRAFPGVWDMNWDQDFESIVSNGGAVGLESPWNGGDIICEKPSEGEDSRRHWSRNASFIVALANAYRCGLLVIAPCDRSGEADETRRGSAEGESTVTGAARQAPSDNPLTETKEGSEHV